MLIAHLSSKELPVIALKIVSETATTPIPSRLLAVSDRLPPRVITTAARDIPLPLISLLLVEYCVLGALVETGTDYGTQISARLDVLARGVRRTIAGALVPLVGLPDLLLPVGFLESD
jgi:hypothetical protein